MSQQSVRQAARRAAMEAQAARRRERAERERRLEALGVQVVVAVSERDAAVVESERRAGEALRQMTDEEGLTVGEAVEWCAEVVSAREATRLRRLASESDLRDATSTTREGVTASPAPGAAGL
jgi:hypothetical protein